MTLAAERALPGDVAATRWRLRSTFPDIAWLMVAQATSGSCVFAASVIRARGLTLDAFGAYALVATVVSFLVIVADFGLSVMMLRDLSKDGVDRRAYVQSAFVLTAVLSAVAAAGVVGVSMAVSRDRAIAPLAWILALSVLFIGLSVAPGAYLRATHRTWVEAIARLCSGSTLIALTGCAAASRTGVFGFGAATAASSASALAIMLPVAMVASGATRPRLDVAQWQRLIRDAAPLAVGMLATAVYYYADSLMLGAFGQREALARYNASYVFVMAVSLFVTALRAAFLPPQTRGFSGATSLAGVLRTYLRITAFAALGIDDHRPGARLDTPAGRLRPAVRARRTGAQSPPGRGRHHVLFVLLRLELARVGTPACVPAGDGCGCTDKCDAQPARDPDVRADGCRGCDGAVRRTGLPPGRAGWPEVPQSQAPPDRRASRARRRNCGRRCDAGAPCLRARLMVTGRSRPTAHPLIAGSRSAVGTPAQPLTGVAGRRLGQTLITATVCAVDNAARRPRMALNVALLADAVETGSPGLRQYLAGLTEGLRELGDDNEYRLVHQRDTGRTGARRSLTTAGATALLRQVQMPAMLSRRGFNVVHDLYPFAPFLRPGRFARVVTIGDLTPLVTHTHSARRSWAHRLVAPIIAHRAHAIVTFSENSKRDITRLFRVPSDRITVSYLAASAQFHPLPTEEIEASRSRLGLPPRYVLHVGTLEPRKNIPTLLRAFAGAPQEMGDMTLLLAGRRGWRMESLPALIQSLGLEQRVVIRSDITVADLPAVYGGAVALAYPSLYEGFGLPPLEAMQCGVPVITSDTSSLPEVVGDAALTVNPGSIADLSRALKRIACDADLRAALQARGLRRAELFTWRRCAEVTRSVYERAFEMTRAPRAGHIQVAQGRAG